VSSTKKGKRRGKKKNAKREQKRISNSPRGRAVTPRSKEEAPGPKRKKANEKMRRPWLRNLENPKGKWPVKKSWSGCGGSRGSPVRGDPWTGQVRRGGGEGSRGKKGWGEPDKRSGRVVGGVVWRATQKKKTLLLKVSRGTP